MNCFHCSGCGMMVFFQNDHCVKCGLRLGFLPDTLMLEALEPAAENQWSPRADASRSRRYKSCANGRANNLCNWMVAADDPDEFCAACRLNDVIPDLSMPGNLARWQKLELAKRRCLYTFLKLRLPLAGNPSLRFRFLGDHAAASPIKTGHENGVITLNIAEADEDERERRRLHLHEPYRTLVGHFRHETGHYYWDRLIAGSRHLPAFREFFGDETADYGAALDRYYQQGARPDWRQQHITAYASVHPWEDWAETWAHYLHIMDTMETAAALGLKVETADDSSPAKNNFAWPGPGQPVDFDGWLARWLPLTCALNSINRGMGLPDLYPFVIPPPVEQKLRFIHTVIETEMAGGQAGETQMLAAAN